MKPVKFDECNVVYAKHQPEYIPLPACVSGNRATFCWELSLRERLDLLFKGRIWQQVLTFNKPLQPQRLSIQKPNMD